MPLLASRLAASMRSKLLAGAAAAVDNAALTAMCTALAEAVIEELTTNGIVLPTGTPPMLAPPGVAGGPVTGTGIIT